MTKSLRRTGVENEDPQDQSDGARSLLATPLCAQ